MYEYLKPIGTIVTLKTVEQKDRLKFMIIGTLMYNDQKELKDYIAVRYPMGAYDAKNFFMFNDKDIDQLIFTGYEDEDYHAYLKYIDELKKYSEQQTAKKAKEKE